MHYVTETCKLIWPGESRKTGKWLGNYLHFCRNSSINTVTFQYTVPINSQFFPSVIHKYELAKWTGSNDFILNSILLYCKKSRNGIILQIKQDCLQLWFMAASENENSYQACSWWYMRLNRYIWHL